MTYAVRVRPAAELDILEAHTWYEGRRPGLGAAFLGAIDNCLDAILQRPFAYTTVWEEVRRALLRRFPYGLFYVVEGTEIVILACLHARRRPGVLRNRP